MNDDPTTDRGRLDMYGMLCVCGTFRGAVCCCAWAAVAAAEDGRACCQLVDCVLLCVVLLVCSVEGATFDLQHTHVPPLSHTNTLSLLLAPCLALSLPLTRLCALSLSILFLCVCAYFSWGR